MHRTRFVLWILDKLPLDILTAALRKRGWVAVPRVYVEMVFAEQTKSGWWKDIAND